MRDEFDAELIKRVAKRLVLTREALGCSHREMAQACGLENRSAWANFEAGYRLITLLSVYRLCNTTGLTADWIILGNVAGLPADLAGKIRAQQEKTRRRSKKLKLNPGDGKKIGAVVARYADGKTAVTYSALQQELIRDIPAIDHVDLTALNQSLRQRMKRLGFMRSSVNSSGQTWHR